MVSSSQISAAATSAPRTRSEAGKAPDPSLPRRCVVELIFAWEEGIKDATVQSSCVSLASRVVVLV